MKINKNKIELVMAKNQTSASELAIKYGCSRTRIYAILNSENIRPKSVGKLIEALGCDAKDIID